MRSWRFHAVATLTWMVALLPLVWAAIASIADGEAWTAIVGDAARITGLICATGIMAIGVAALATPAGVVMAIALVRFRFPLRLLAAILLAAAAFEPLVLYAGGWQATFGPAGILGASADTRFGGIMAATIIHAVAAIPWTTGVMALGLWLSDRRAEEEATLHAPPLTVLQALVMPQMRRALAAAGLIAIVPVMTDMTVSDLFVVRTFAEEVYTQFEAGAGDHAAVLLALIPTGVLSLALFLALRKFADRGLGLREIPKEFEPTGAAWGLIAAAGAITLLVASPFAGLVWQLGLSATEQGEAGETAWSARVAAGYLQAEGMNIVRIGPSSLFVSALAAAASVTASAVLAWQVRWSGSAFRSAALLAMVALFVFPGPALGVALIEIFNRPGILGQLYDSRFVVGYAQAIRALPFAFAIIAVALGRIERDGFDAAIVHGAARTRDLLGLALGQTRSARLIAYVASLAICFAEFPATRFVAPPGFDSLSVWTFHLLHVGTANQQAALCLITGGVVALIGVLGIELARA